MIAMVATGVLPLSSDANEAMLKAAHKMTAKIMDRAGRRRVITRSGSALRDESPFWWREVAQENSFGPTRYPGRPEHVAIS